MSPIESGPQLAPRTVYLVDDDDAVRAALSLLLRNLNIEVEAFADPLVFLDTVPGHPPGCLVIDIRMPALSG